MIYLKDYLDNNRELLLKPYNGGWKAVITTYNDGDGGENTVVEGFGSGPEEAIEGTFFEVGA